MRAATRLAVPALVLPCLATLVTLPALPAHAAGSSAGTSAEGATPSADAAKLGATLLGRHKGSTEERIVSLMGPPASATARDGGRRLVWHSPASNETPTPPACALSADFAEGKLAALEIAGTPQFDKKTCRKLARPLLDASGPAGAQGGGAAVTTLTNDSIVELVKAGYPPEAIIAKVKTDPCKFDLSVEATIALRRAGVKESIIQAMTDRGCS